MKRLIVIPTYNEVENVKIIIPRIFKYISNASILIVDDGSPDGTAEVCKDMQSNYPNLFVEKRLRKSGLGTAYRFGFNWGLEKDFTDFVLMDADLSHRVRDLSVMLSKRESDPSISLVIGSRWTKGGKTENWPKQRELLSRTANLYVRLLLGMGVKDNTAGFRVYSSEILREIHLEEIKSEGYSFHIEMTRSVRKLRGKIIEVPITFRERESGVSKMSGAIVREAMLLVTVWGLKRFLRLK